MKRTSGTGSISPRPRHNTMLGYIGAVCILTALPCLYLGVSMSGVMGYSLVAFSIMALVAALGIGHSLLVKSKNEALLNLESSPEPVVENEPLPESISKPLSLSTDVEALAVFDSDYLLDTMDGDRDMVTMLLEVFVDEHLDDGHKIVKALRDGDLDQVQMISHSLKGVSASLGAEQIQALSEQVERQVITQADPVQLEKLCELLKMVFTPAALAIQAFLDESEEIKLRELSQEGNIHSEQPQAGAAMAEPVGSPVAETSETQANKPVVTSIGQPSKDEGAETDSETSPEIAEACEWLDVDALRDAMDGDEETVCMLLEIFVEDNAGKGQVLVAAASEPGQQEHALNIVHALKGVAANLSARPLRECTGVVEAKFKQNEPVTVEECQKVERILNYTIATAEAYLTKAAIGA